MACSECVLDSYLKGPEDTPFSGGRFELAIRVPEQYPLVPPTVSFRTKIFHPNVHFKVREVPVAARACHVEVTCICMRLCMHRSIATCGL
jgi:Ubiquitin-conjugating enzyme